MEKNKLILPVVILLGFIIWGGFFYASQINKKQDNFQKKIDCEKYKSQILDKINRFNSAQKPELRNGDNTGTNPDYNLYVESDELKEIFYSPKVNSCLYVESDKTLMKLGADAKPDVGNWSTLYETYYLIDALTNEKIDFYQGLPFLQIISRGDVFNSEKQANEIISAYK
ncbi:MAG: hypothetical protein NT026_00660 [Candidatus Staskawiczbacteria bacterium]|nr:hypothetical protein [Candidatus Staskawiczbacteria bacterium]